MGGAWREVGEERLVRHQRLLLAYPGDRMVGDVLGEVVTLLGGAVGLHGRGVLIERGRVLVCLAADEAVEVLEPATTRGPVVEGAHRAGLPDRHLVTLAELRGRVAVQLERLGQRRAVVGPHRAVPRRRGRDLGDATHADAVVVATREQGCSGRRTQRCRVEPGVAQTLAGQPVEGRGLGRTPERAGGTEAAVIDQHDQHVRCGAGGPQRHDRWERRIRILRVIGRGRVRRLVGNRQNLTLNLAHESTSAIAPTRLSVLSQNARPDHVRRHPREVTWNRTPVDGTWLATASPRWCHRS